MTENVDHRVVDNLKDIMGDSFGSILDKFFSTSREMIEGIYAAIKAGDVVVISRTAHSLKSSSAQLGAKRMSELCLKIEHEKDVSKAKETLALVEAEFAEVKKELQKYI